MDIVPTREQWRVASNPAAAIAYFHWPFLARPAAPEMILAMGGAKFAQFVFDKSSGDSDAGVALLHSDDAIKHYLHLFDQEETIRGSCADYADGGIPECKEQDEDQAAGRKIKVPTLVLYSGDNLGKMHDVEAAWKPYVDAELKTVSIGPGIGHYIPESAPEVVDEEVTAWIKKTA